MAAAAGQRHAGLELHLVGPLQSNKAREAVALFDAIHSRRPREPRARRWPRRSRGRGAGRCCSSRSIPAPSRRRRASLPRRCRRFLAACRDRHGLAISGLMCIPPEDEAPAPHFALTAKIARRNGLKLLSMGMSADFPTAIAFGATHVRVGTAIFGARK